MSAPSAGTWSRIDPVLTVLALAAVFALLSAGALHKVWAADFWWQYRTGQHVLQSGPPHQDIFSFTVSGAPWIEMRWLYCVVLSLIVQVFHPAGAVVGTWLAVLVSFGLAAAIAVERRTVLVGCGALTIALLASSQRFLIRPELATYVLMAVFLWILAKHRSRPSRAIYALPLLQLVWVNSHTLFALGPLLIGLMLVVTALEAWDHRRTRSGGTSGAGIGEGASLASAKNVRTLALVLAATLLACLLNPYGLRVFGFSLDLVREIHGTAFKDNIVEFRSPFSFSYTTVAVAYYEGLIALCLLSALLNRKRLDGFWTVLVLSQLYLSVTAIRNIPLFALSAVPFILVNVKNAPPAVHPFVSRILPAARRGLALLVIAVCAGYSWDLATDRFSARQGLTSQFGVGVARHRFPDDAVRFLDEAGLSGPLFNTLIEGSYLVATGRKVFIDGRLEVYGDEFYDRFMRMQQAGSTWRDAVQEFDLRAALVDLQSPLAARLASSREWNLLYFDEVAAVFQRADVPSSRRAIRTSEDFQEAITRLRARLPAPTPFGERGWFERVPLPMPYLRVAGFLRANGQAAGAALFARDALAAYPYAPGARAALAQILEGQGDVAGAVREYQAALALEPDNRTARRSLGLDLYLTGRMEEARGFLEASLEEAPSDPLAWAVLSKIHEQAGRSAEAISCAESTVAFAPREPGFQKILGRLYMTNGDARRAIKTLGRAVRLAPGDPTLHRDLAVLLLESGLRAEAIATLEKGLAAHPADPDLVRLLATMSSRPVVK